MNFNLNTFTNNLVYPVGKNPDRVKKSPLLWDFVNMIPVMMTSNDENL